MLFYSILIVVIGLNPNSSFWHDIDLLFKVIFVNNIKRKLNKNIVSVEVGKRYSWCSCGFSKNQPFCDGTHKKKGESQPVRMWFDKDQNIFFSRESGKLQLKIEEKS